MDKLSLTPLKPEHKPAYKLWIFLSLVFLFLGYLLNNISAILLPFISGLIGAYVFSKPAQILVNRGLSRGLATFIIIFAVIMMLVIFGFLALPFLKNELVALGQSIPAVGKRLMGLINPVLDNLSATIGQPEIDKYRTQLSSYVGDIVSWSVQLMINLLSNGLAIANLISLVFLTPLIMFYILKDWPRFVAFIDGLLPTLYAPQIREQMKKVDLTLGAYARGQVMVCLSLIVLYSLTLWAFGLPHAFFIGFITGFFAFIPYMGAIIGFTAAMAIALNQYESLTMIGAIGSVFVVMSIIEGYILTPRFIGDRIGLHPVWIIFALLSLGTLFGLVGVVFALPLAAIIATLLRTFLEWYREKFVRE